MEPHSLAGGTGEGGWVGMGLACGLQDQRLMARPPARAGGRGGSLTGGKVGNGMVFLLPFPKGTCSRPQPAQPVGGPLRAFQCEGRRPGIPSEVQPPPTQPHQRRGSRGRNLLPRGFFPPFLPKKWSPGRAGQGSLPFQRRGQNPQHPQPLKKCAFVPGQAGTRTHCQLLNCTKLSDRHRLERGVDDLSPIQIPSLQTVNENLRRGGVGGERNVVLVAHLVDILQVGVQVAGLGV